MLQGGDLSAQSAPGEGTRMTLTLPFSRIVRDAPHVLPAVG